MFSTRTAQSDDIKILVEMMNEFYGESSYSLNHQEAQNSFSLLLSNSSLGCIWITSINNRDIGYVVMTKRFSMEHGGIVAEIDDLFVTKDWRRRGVGKLLLSALLQYCKEQNILAVGVEVGAENQAAQNLYQKFGFLPHNDNRQTLVVKVTQ